MKAYPPTLTVYVTTVYVLHSILSPFFQRIFLIQKTKSETPLTKKKFKSKSLVSSSLRFQNTSSHPRTSLKLSEIFHLYICNVLKIFGLVSMKEKKVVFARSTRTLSTLFFFRIFFSHIKNTNFFFKQFINSYKTNFINLLK